MTTKVDRRRAALVLPYTAPPIASYTVADYYGTATLFFLLAATFLRSRYVAWGAFLTALLSFLNTRYSLEGASPGMGSAMMLMWSATMLGMMYMPVYLELKQQMDDSINTMGNTIPLS